MKIIDAHTGAEVTLGKTIPLPGGGWYRVVRMPSALLVAINELGYKLFGWGWDRPRIVVESSDPSMNGKDLALPVHIKRGCEPIAFVP